MVRSLFSLKLTTPVSLGKEAKQIRIRFLLPIVFITILYSVFSLTVSIFSKEYGLMITFISSVILLLICIDFLRNESVNAAVVLFLVQGFGLLTSLLLFREIDLIPQILFVIFYLIVAGLITTPRVFSGLFIYSAALIYLMVSEIVAPIFPVQNLPGWFSFTASMIFMLILIAYAIFLAYRAIMQSIQIAEYAHKLQDQVEQEKNKYFSMIEQSPLSIFMTDLDGKIEYVNPKFTELMEYELEEIRGKTPRVLKTEHTPPDFHEDLWNKITEGRTWIGEFINRKKDETTLIQSAVIRPLIDSSGEKTGYVAFEDDISLQKEIAQEMKVMDQELKDQSTEIRQLKDQLQEQSIHDPVTGLYNRVHLNKILPREILRSTRAKNQLIFMVIDIDHFRSINQHFGYTVGDQVLKSIADSITASLGDFDIAFRIGNDEFVVLFSERTNEMGEPRAQEIREAIEKLTIQKYQDEIKLSVSIGIAVYPVHGKQDSDLFLKAEQALTLSQLSGGNRISVWTEE